MLRPDVSVNSFACTCLSSCSSLVGSAVVFKLSLTSLGVKLALCIGWVILIGLSIGSLLLFVVPLSTNLSKSEISLGS